MSWWRNSKEEEVSPLPERKRPPAPTAPVPKKPSQSPRTEGLSMIPEGINITGNIDGTGHLRIDGKVKGDVQLRGRLEVGVSGQVDGDLRAEDVLVLGLVRGNIHSRTGLLLKAKCRVQGNISCRSLTVEGGAWFCGRCDMRGDGGAQATEKPSDKVDMKRAALPAERPRAQTPGTPPRRPEQQPVRQEGRAVQPKLG